MSDLGDFLSHNNMAFGLRYDPEPYVLCTGRQLPEPSTKGNAMGSGIVEFARHLPFHRCLRNLVVAQKISPCYLNSQIYTCKSLTANTTSFILVYTVGISGGV